MSYFYLQRGRVTIIKVTLGMSSVARHSYFCFQGSLCWKPYKVPSTKGFCSGKFCCPYPQNLVQENMLLDVGRPDAVPLRWDPQNPDLKTTTGSNVTCSGVPRDSVPVTWPRSGAVEISWVWCWPRGGSIVQDTWHLFDRKVELNELFRCFLSSSGYQCPASTKYGGYMWPG